MAKFHTFAEPVTENHVAWAAYAAGVKKNPPGVRLQEVLDRTGGVYEQNLEIRENYRERIRAAARLAKDDDLMRIADHPTIAISLEHLRGIDPQTPIIIGYMLQLTPEEREQLGLEQEPEDFDPKKMVNVKSDPDKPWRISRG